MKTKRTFRAMLSLITIGLLAGTGGAVADTDNYAESFETYIVGTTVTNLNSDPDSDWVSGETNSMIVATNYFSQYPAGLAFPIPGYEHDSVDNKVLKLAIDKEMTNTIVAGNSNMSNWLDVVISPVFSTDDQITSNTIPDVGTVAAVRFNTNGNPVVMHTPTDSFSAQWVTITNRTVSEHDWIRLTIVADFASVVHPANPTRFYQVYIDGVRLTNEVAYATPNRIGFTPVPNGTWFGNRRTNAQLSPFTNIIFKGTGYIDDLVVTNALTLTPPTPAAVSYIASVGVSNSLFYGQIVADAGVYGTATNAAGGSVPGEFNFDDPNIVPPVGTQSYAFTFTPDDPGTYQSATGSVSVTTVASTPAVTWPTASELSEGDTLGDVIFSGGSATNAYLGSFIDGDFAFVDDATNVPPLGTNSYQVTFTPSNSVNYVTVTSSVDVVVGAAGGPVDPNVTVWPTATAIVYGQALSSSTLEGGTADAAGGFFFVDDTITPSAGNYAAQVEFVPSDEGAYFRVTNNVTVSVAKATPTATLNISNTPQTYDATAQTASVAIQSSSTPGAVANVVNGTQTDVGTYPVTADFVPTDTANYNTLIGLSAGNFVIAKAAPTVTWPGTSEIAQGQTLAKVDLLDASATGVLSEPLAGVFGFVAPTSTVVNATADYDVSFAPGSVNYASVTQAVTVTALAPATQTTNAVPVSYYVQFGLAPSDEGVETFGELDQQNSDTDPFSNWQEYIAGTDPTDPDSMFRILGVSPDGTLQWIGGTNGPASPYIVESATSLVGTTIGWMDMTNAAARAVTNTWTDTSGGTIRFYRVRATAP